jgi:hypothetical protein
MRTQSRRRRALLVLAAVFIAMTAGEGAFFYRMYQRLCVEQTDAKKTEIAALIRGRAAGVITPEFFGNAVPVDKQSVYREFFAQIQSPEIVRMKSWDRDTTVLWSNLSEIIGQKFPDNEEVGEAYGGDVVVTVEAQKPEQVSERQFATLVEFYVPITDESGKVFGVIEVYEPEIVVDRKAISEVWNLALPVGGFSPAAYALLAYFLLRSKKKAKPGQAPS